MRNNLIFQIEGLNYIVNTNEKNLQLNTGTISEFQRKLSKSIFYQTEKKGNFPTMESFPQWVQHQLLPYLQYLKTRQQRKVERVLRRKAVTLVRFMIMATDPLRYIGTNKENNPYLLPQPITQHLSTAENSLNTISVMSTTEVNIKQ